MNNEMRFVPNPDYPPDWEQKEREKLGDCFQCGNFQGLGCYGVWCRKSLRPLSIPRHGCECRK